MENVIPDKIPVVEAEIVEKEERIEFPIDIIVIKWKKMTFSFYDDILFPEFKQIMKDTSADKKREKESDAALISALSIEPKLSRSDVLRMPSKLYLLIQQDVLNPYVGDFRPRPLEEEED